MSQIRDILQIKTLERALRRRLTEEEMSGEPFRAVFPDGNVDYVVIELLQFPHDLLSKAEDFYISELDSLPNVA